MFKFSIILLLFVCDYGHAASVETVNAEIAIDSAERSIDIASQLVKINTKLTLTNNGKGAITGFHFGLEEFAKEKLAFIGATVIYESVFLNSDNNRVFF